MFNILHRDHNRSFSFHHGSIVLYTLVDLESAWPFFEQHAEHDRSIKHISITNRTFSCERISQWNDYVNTLRIVPFVLYVLIMVLECNKIYFNLKNKFCRCSRAEYELSIQTPLWRLDVQILLQFQFSQNSTFLNWPEFPLWG